MLQAAGLPQLLLDHGLVTPADVVDRGLRIVERSRSHSLLLVTVGDTGGFVVKQSDPARVDESARLEQEAALYAHAAARPELRAVLPACHVTRPGLLILELVAARTLHEHHHDAGLCAPEISGAFGRALGAAHRALAMDPPAGFGAALPWILSVFEPGGADFAWEAPAVRDTLAGLPDPAGMRAALARARAQWRPRHVIHSDVKWDNVLLLDDPARATVKIIDWELAVVGDPAWDLAGALQEYVVFAITTGTLPVARHAGAIAELWEGYESATGLPAGRRARLVERSARLAGARLLQTACEVAVQSPGAASVHALAEHALELLTAPESLMDAASHVVVR